MADKKKKEMAQDSPYHRYNEIPYDYCPENIPENIRDNYYRNVSSNANQNSGYSNYHRTFYNDEMDKMGRNENGMGMRNLNGNMAQNSMMSSHPQIPMQKTMHGSTGSTGKNNIPFNSQMIENTFYNNEDMSESTTSEKRVKKTGRKKISMEYIEGKNKRSVTFSKRKKGIMKKAYELNVLTGTQILLLVASESGHVYTFATPKLKPIIQNHERLIQTCLNAPSSPNERQPNCYRNENEKDDDMFMNYGDYYSGYDQRHE